MYAIGPIKDKVLPVYEENALLKKQLTSGSVLSLPHPGGETMSFFDFSRGSH